MTTSPFSSLTAPEPITALQWVGEDRLVVAGGTAMGLYNLEGHLLASIREGARALAWHPETVFIRYLRSHPQSVECSTPRDWDWETGAIREVDQSTCYANCGLFDHQGNYVHGGEYYEWGYLRGLDAAGQNISSTDKLPIVADMAFSPDGTKLLVGCKRLQLSIWQHPSHSGSPEKVYRTKSGIFSIAWSDSGRYVAAAQVTGRVEIWDLVSDERVAEIIVIPADKEPPHTLIRKIRFLPGSDHLLLVSTFDFTRLIDWQEGEIIRSANGYCCFALSPSGELVALGSMDGKLYYCDALLWYAQR